MLILYMNFIGYNVTNNFDGTILGDFAAAAVFTTATQMYCCNRGG